MNRRHARYPFFESAREAVEAAGVDLGELVGAGDVEETDEEGATADDGGAAVDEGDAMVVARARERVETALSEGHIGTNGETGMHRSTRIELLSYPIARILVSLLDEPMAIEAYARAEASTARQRLAADLPESAPADGFTGGGLGEELGSRGGTAGADDRLSVHDLLGEFGLGDAIEGRDPFLVDVSVYLELARDLEGQDWALVERSLSAGRVPVDRSELYALLERAVADRVADGLPLSVPEPIADGLAEPRDDIEGMLADEEIPLAFDRVEPAQFPPCVDALLERARDGESLPPHSLYALVGFLGATGMDAAAIADLAGGGLDRETVEYQLAHVRDDRGLEYAPPSCATMDAYGDCVNTDERCDTVNHPLSYYEAALEDVGGD
ncbi:DNA primase large subunit [Salinarchaeum sp. Harcht-Bsk1]|uniref:DNA primase large subunit PriL n=1 Tax=Salinarchaeum sp. Harcht-Bsk1 TaxID=1333523 RepID=UPI0003423C92|nr:DNA primase large subunit PriL [Salinarchaeum sp. Harcht-Bsk1]AGN01451.1 DNA primase large subunit [Salinarchaeum sp. Harcht-Bsk1]